jgi:HEAT repeats/PBS lyase HEAT-like repeat
LFWRLLAPKPLKKTRRAMHPLSMLAPRPVRNVKRAAAKTLNPIGALGDAAENAVVHAARGGKRRRKGGSGSGSRLGSGSAAGTNVEHDDTYPEDAPLPEVEEREALGLPPLTLKSAAQGEILSLRSEDGALVAVTIDQVFDPISPRAEYDLPGEGHHLVAVRVSLVNEGPRVFAYDPGYESKLIGASGGEYASWQADLHVPTYNGVVRLGLGASRSAHVCYAIADGDRPEPVEVVFGIDLQAEIGQWKIESVEPASSPPQPASEADVDEEKTNGHLELWTRMLGEPDGSRRQAAASALARLGDPAARDVLLVALKDPDFEVRTHALIGLVNLGGDELVHARRAALQDPHPYLRERAVKELARVGSKEAVEAIRSALSDVDESVRVTARRELKTLATD